MTFCREWVEVSGVSGAGGEGSIFFIKSKLKCETFNDKNNYKQKCFSLL